MRSIGSTSASMGKWAMGGLAVAAGFALASLHAPTDKGLSFMKKADKKAAKDRATIAVNRQADEVLAFFNEKGYEGKVEVGPFQDGKMSLVTALDAEISELDLRQLKALLETGEVATIMGQSHGERSMVGKFFRSYDSVRTIARRAQA